MDAIRGLSGVNLNVLGLVTTAVTSAATTTTITAVATGGILTVARDGKKAALSAGAKAFAQYKGDGTADTSTRTLKATASTGQAAIVVHGLLNISGTETLVQVIGDAVDLDVNGNITSNKAGISFPNIGDLIVPVAYTLVKNPAGSSTATFTFGTSNWNATSIVTSTAGDLAALPRRPLTAA